MLKKSSTYISLLIVASVSVFLIWSALASTVYTFSGEVDDVSTASHTVDLNAGDEVLAWAGCAETTPGSGDRPLDPDLTVFDPTDTEIAYNDDGNDPTCNNYSSSCVIFTAATTGTYRFDIGDVLGSGPFPAPYELRVEVNNPAAVCGAYDFEAPIDEEPVDSEEPVEIMVPLDDAANGFDIAAPFKVYCEGSNINVYAINGDASGNLAFSTTPEEIAEVAEQPTENTVIEAGLGVRLFRLTSGEFQIVSPDMMDGTRYNVIFTSCDGPRTQRGFYFPE